MKQPVVAIGGLQHETNTFASIQTTLDDFIQSAAWPGLTEGEALFDTFSNSNIAISGFINAAQHWKLVPLLWAQAEPLGYVQQSAFDHLADRLIDHINKAPKLDAIYLDLHGAMVTKEYDDAEAELLGRIRKVVGEEIPIAVSLDLHGNLSPKFFEHASCVTVYRTYPHIDLAATGARAQVLLSQLLERGKPFAKAMRQLDYIIPITAQSTFREPGKSLYAVLPDYAMDGVLSIDMALGFPPADIPDNGPSVFAYGEEQGAVDYAADQVLLTLQQAESEFENPLLDAIEAVKQAKQLSRTASKPVVIADPQDNPGAGGAGSTTGLIHALLDEGATNACVSAIWDPKTAALAHSAGAGSDIEICLGGRAGEEGNEPIQMLAHVEYINDGVFDFTGAMYEGSTGQLGQCARLRLKRGDADVQVVVASVRCQNADLALFTAFGIVPEQQSILVVKSAVHFLAAYEPIAETVLFAKAVGENLCDLSELPFTKLRKGLRIAGSK